MFKSVRFFLPLVLFAIVLLCAGYSAWEAWNEPGETSAVPPSAPDESGVVFDPPTVTPSPAPPPAATAAPVVVVISTPIPAPSFTPSAVPPSPTTGVELLPSPEISATLTATPITGVVVPGLLNVRQGPSVNYLMVGGLKEGDEVTVLQRTPPGADVGDWLEVKIPNGRIGWVAAKHIALPADSLVPVASVAPTPLPRPAVTRNTELINLKEKLDVEGGSVSGELGPHQERWYTFFDEDVETVIIFIFRPNLNFYDTRFAAYEVQFFLHDQNQIPVWPPADPEALEDVNIGAGTHEGDRDNNYDTGELVWRGGPLVPGVQYYLRFVNRSSEPVRYCLIPGDVREWVCPKPPN